MSTEAQRVARGHLQPLDVFVFYSPMQAEPSGLYDLLAPPGLARSVPRSRSEDAPAQEADVHRFGQDPRAGQAGRGLGRLREPADVGARG